MLKCKRSNVLKLFLSLFVILTLVSNHCYVAKAGGDGVTANYISGGYNKANPIQIKCIFGSQSLTDAARTAWNGVSSKVVLSAAVNTNTICTYFDIYDPPTPSTYGRTYKYYGSQILGENDTTSMWNKAEVYQYKAKDLNTTAKKKYTAIHECGHALSIAHPTNSNVGAVMKQGAFEYTSLYTFDTKSLKGKWGS